MAGVSVVVVGVDNSPWVQTVLLFLHDRGIPCELTAVPNPETIRANGNVIPVIQVYEGGELVQTVADSARARPIHSKGARTAAASTPIGPRISR
jgi:hypothetical protein